MTGRSLSLQGYYIVPYFSLSNLTTKNIIKLTVKFNLQLKGSILSLKLD